MEMYKKPIMKIVELEKVDVLTCSQTVNGLACQEGHDTHNLCNDSCHRVPNDVPQG